MRIHLVPNTQMLKDNSDHAFAASVFREAYILQSFVYCDDFTEQVIIPNCRDFMLDSGAFSFMTGKKGKINWDEYIERYADFIVRNNVKKFFELDIDDVVGYERVKQFRRDLERKTGRQSIPVWHFPRGKEEWLRMCEEHDYVAIGGLVQIKGSAEYAEKYRRYFPWFIKTAHERGAKVHALGFTALKALEKYHFDSVDSSSWSIGNRYGVVYKFDGSTIVTLKKKAGTRITDHQKLSLHNFNEWVKFSKYAEVHL